MFKLVGLKLLTLEETKKRTRRALLPHIRIQLGARTFPGIVGLKLVVGLARRIADKSL